MADIALLDASAQSTMVSIDELLQTKNLRSHCNLSLIGFWLRAKNEMTKVRVCYTEYP